MINETAKFDLMIKMLEIAEGNSWQLRYHVGPDAIPFLQWRASMTDEEHVDWNAANDEDCYNAVQNTFGLNARQEYCNTG